MLQPKYYELGNQLICILQYDIMIFAHMLKINLMPFFYINEIPDQFTGSLGGTHNFKIFIKYCLFSLMLLEFSIELVLHSIPAVDQNKGHPLSTRFWCLLLVVLLDITKDIMDDST